MLAGGFVAAATAPAASEHGTWAAAYLVLVAGAAQVALGVGQAVLAPATPRRRTVAGELAGWNAGSAAVIGGAVLGLPACVDAGGTVLALALATVVVAVRGNDGRTDRALWVYRLLVSVLMVSIPIGIALAHLDPA